jgi:hypothetical protein
MMGFGQAFWVISNVNPQAEFGTVGNAVLNAYLVMLGQLTPDSTLTVAPKFATFLTCMMLMILIIVMLNALIALMGDTFANVRGLGLALWRREQATIIFEQAFSRSDERLYVPPHIHVLHYTSDVTLVESSEDSALAALVSASKSIVTPFTELSEEEELFKSTQATQEESHTKPTENLIVLTEAQLNDLVQRVIQAQRT